MVVTTGYFDPQGHSKCVDKLKEFQISLPRLYDNMAKFGISKATRCLDSLAGSRDCIDYRGTLSITEQSEDQRTIDLVDRLEKETAQALEVVNQLRGHAQFMAHLTEMTAELDKPTCQNSNGDEVGFKIPPLMYKFFYYLEAKALQRVRRAMEEDAPVYSHRLWKRKLYSNVRARVRQFLKNAELHLDEQDRRPEGAAGSEEPLHLGSIILFDAAPPETAFGTAELPGIVTD